MLAYLVVPLVLVVASLVALGLGLAFFRLELVAYRCWPLVALVVPFVVVDLASCFGFGSLDLFGCCKVFVRQHCYMVFFVVFPSYFFQSG